MAHININYIRDKFDMPNEYMDILMTSEIKFEEAFLHVLYHFSNSYRLDRNSHAGETLVYVRNNIPSNLVKLDQKFENFEGFIIKFELSKKNKLFLSNFYNTHKGNIK